MNKRLIENGTWALFLRTWTIGMFCRIHQEHACVLEFLYPLYLCPANVILPRRHLFLQFEILSFDLLLLVIQFE